MSENQTFFFDDDQRFGADSRFGRPCRFLRSSSRRDAIVQRIVNGRDVLQFRVGRGDHCGEDLRQESYKANPALTPERCMQAFEGWQNERPYGRLITVETRINIQPGAPQTSRFCVLMQFNAGPLAGEFWKPPPFSVELGQAGGVESLLAIVHTNPVAGQTHRQARRIVAGAIPIDRRVRDLRFEVIDSRGGPGGLVRAWLDDVPFADYRDPVGYPNHRGLFLGRGIYRAPDGKGEALAVHFEGLRETVAA